MKLIIDIPDNEYKQNKHYYDSVYHGTPLDDVKEEIEDCSFDHYFEYGEYIGENPIQHRICMTDKVLDILDNIGKVESEDKGMTREEAIKYFECGIKTNLHLKEKDKYAVEIANENIEAYSMAISALSENKGEWIPVSERLPEELKGVLVYCPTNDNIFCVYLEKGVWKIFSPIATEEIKEIVTAWQPLPEHYRKAVSK